MRMCSIFRRRRGQYKNQCLTIVIHTNELWEQIFASPVRLWYALPMLSAWFIGVLCCTVVVFLSYGIYKHLRHIRNEEFIFKIVWLITHTESHVSESHASLKSKRWNLLLSATVYEEVYRVSLSQVCIVSGIRKLLCVTLRRLISDKWVFQG